MLGSVAAAWTERAHGTSGTRARRRDDGRKRSASTLTLPIFCLSVIVGDFGGAVFMTNRPGVPLGFSPREYAMTRLSVTRCFAADTGGGFGFEGVRTLVNFDQLVVNDTRANVAGGAMVRKKTNPLCTGASPCLPSHRPLLLCVVCAVGSALLCSRSPSHQLSFLEHDCE